MDNETIELIRDLITGSLREYGLLDHGINLANEIESIVREQTGLRAPAGRIPDAIRDEIRSYYTGDNVRQLCERYGVSRATVYRIINEKRCLN